MNLKQAAWFSAVPWGMMAISGYIAGAASDSLIASGYPVTRVRKIMQVIFFKLITRWFIHLFESYSFFFFFLPRYFALKIINCLNKAFLVVGS